MRSGATACHGKTSMMPPRTANWPRPETVGMRSYWWLASELANAAGSSVRPTFNTTRADTSVAGEGQVWANASLSQITIEGLGCVSE